MFKRILIANRGEIAVRIFRACRELDIEPIVVYSEADREALHVQLAEHAYCIGPAPSAKSYLDVDAILTVAKNTGCDAIHPGYGFLSENADFARRCVEEGIAFIGPSADVIERMGRTGSALIRLGQVFDFNHGETPLDEVVSNRRTASRRRLFNEGARSFPARDYRAA